MSVQNLACPHCQQYLEIPEELIGQHVECPLCNQTFVASIPESASLQQTPAPEKETKSCPFCGEEILEIAKKCKHCGEFLTDAPPADDVSNKKKISLKKKTSLKKGKKTISTKKPGTSSTPKNATCPKCGSTSIQVVKKGFGAEKGCCGIILAGPLGLICGWCGANKMSSVCVNCGHKRQIGKI